MNPLLADMGESEWSKATRASRHEEWHVTVDGVSPLAWETFCCLNGIKPLFIELNNFNTQLMCAAKVDPSNRIREDGINIVRIKHEVSVPVFSEAQLYWECHVKLDGPFNPKIHGASRDLYRANRWYVTHRRTAAFKNDFAWFIDLVVEQGNKFAGYEYECAVLDTNPELDRGWL